MASLRDWVYSRATASRALVVRSPAAKRRNVRACGVSHRIRDEQDQAATAATLRRCVESRFALRPNDQTESSPERYDSPVLAFVFERNRPIRGQQRRQRATLAFRLLGAVLAAELRYLLGQFRKVESACCRRPGAERLPFVIAG